MGAICAIVLAGVCIAVPYEHAVTLNAFYTNPTTADAERPAAIERLGARIEIWRSDNLVTKDTTGGQRACGDGGCVVYTAACSPNDLECRYEWKAEAPRGFEGASGTLTMHARSRVEMERARKAVFVRTGTDVGDWIPLAGLRIERANLLAGCGNNPLASCYNPYAGLWPPVPRQR